jgi:glutamate dehydrogenase
LPPDVESALTARAAELEKAGVPEELAKRVANLRALSAAPDIISVADRTGKPVQDVAATYYAAGAFFQLDRIANAARGIQVTDYFDRLALDRALDSIGESERRLTAEMVGNGVTGPEAVDAWVSPRAGEVERIRTAVHGIASSGLTISKLSVAASLLGDLARQ